MNTLRDARLGTTNLTQRRPLYTGVQRPSRWPLRRLTEPEGAKSPTGERLDLTEVFMASKFAAPNATATSLPEAFANASPRAGPDLAGKPAARDVAQQLWNALCDAKAANLPSTRAHLEDAIFGYYLPWVRTLARQQHQWIAEPVATEQAAELGLAQALLAWHHRVSDGFIGFAEVSIRSQLRRLESGVFAHASANIATVPNLGFAPTRND
jgi:hypothetical protein